MAPDDDWLTTAQAAELMRCSRQHVVDVCERGRLPFVKAGSHRRLRRADVEAFLTAPLTRDQERSLWLHRALVGRLLTDPDAALAAARRNLATLRRAHPAGAVRGSFDTWQRILDGSIDDLLDVLVSRSPSAVELRQNSPFAGVLQESSRQQVLRTFRDHWRREHAA